jgi:hypothetical protein
MSKLLGVENCGADTFEIDNPLNPEEVDADAPQRCNSQG